MSVEEIKQNLKALSVSEQEEVSNYLKCLRLFSDQSVRDEISARLDDKDPSHWVSLDELKRRFPEDWSDE